LPNHLLSFQIMKKKNTGVNESNQGHRAKWVETILNENPFKFSFLFTWYNVLSRLPTKKVKRPVTGAWNPQSYTTTRRSSSNQFGVFEP
jgi:hypothetical protein